MSNEALLQALVRLNDLPGFCELLPVVDVNWQNPRCDQWTALHLACEEGKVQFVRELLRHPAIEVNQRDVARQTPFWWACSWNRVKVVEELLRDCRIDINLPNDEGETPVWTAAYYGYSRIILMLIASGRQLNLDKKARFAPTGEFVTAAEIARKRGKPEVLNLLERYRCNGPRITFEARVTLGYGVELASELFALIILHCDGYLELRGPGVASKKSQERAMRFFGISAQLPLELQMVLCARLFDTPTDVILTKHFESSLRDLVRAICHTT